MKKVFKLIFILVLIIGVFVVGLQYEIESDPHFIFMFLLFLITSFLFSWFFKILKGKSNKENKDV